MLEFSQDTEGPTLALLKQALGSLMSNIWQYPHLTSPNGQHPSLITWLWLWLKSDSKGRLSAGPVLPWLVLSADQLPALWIRDVHNSRGCSCQVVTAMTGLTGQVGDIWLGFENQLCGTVSDPEWWTVHVCQLHCGPAVGLYRDRTLKKVNCFNCES